MNGDDPHLEEILKGHTCKVETFGLSEGVDLRAENLELVGRPGYLGIRYTVTGKLNFDVEVDIPGKFSVYNSLTAIAICRHFNVETEMIQKALDKNNEIRIKKNVSLKKWKNAMKKIVSYELANGNIQFGGTLSEVNITTECDKVIFYSLKDEDSESFYALNPEIINYKYVYRLILEYCANDMEIILDFSNLDNWADDCIPKALAATENVSKTIVLVEGSSDKDILEFAMSQLYPHLSDLFYFMDFSDESGGKRDGGTSYVIKNLKTFYFSKIRANFIAIFDNDAEGYSSKCSLLNEIKNWPANFRILLYPEITMFHKYPTIAPNGKIVPDDINKKAASIELYLPDSIIKTGGNYYPIEWESRKRIRNKNNVEEALYQGVISYKDDIKHKFHEMRNKIERGDEVFKTEEWKNMKKLLETIVFAFNNEQ